MKKLLIFLISILVLFSCTTKNNIVSLAVSDLYPLLPMPQELLLVDGQLTSRIVKRNPKITVGKEFISKSQGYILTFDSGKPFIQANDEVGVFYAKQTLNQIISLLSDYKKLPAIKIIDWPDIANRGVMVDISRDKVPTMDSLYALIDQLSKWKVNQFQLYTEHTFAYKNHKEVWRDASPITAEEILLLDKYCKDRFIELVPNQNSFGHMNRWLKHDTYKQLAECEVPTNGQWGYRSRNILSPAEPKSLELIDELFAELLPNFSSEMFNIGCDETIELGMGKSKSNVAKLGRGRVYLDYLLKLYEKAGLNGKQVQFWGDIILNHPTLISKLPKDMIALVWGYEKNHPFAYQSRKFRRAGNEFYLCPGTSSWNSISGRFTNMKGNLLNAAINAKKYGATGFLNTNWGDYGNWQSLTFCQPGYLYGAAIAWAPKQNEFIPIDKYLSRYLYDDKSGESGRAICR